MLSQPKNVVACLDWYRKNRPDLLPQIEDLFCLGNMNNRGAEAAIALMLQGFEAGRDFQKEFPDVEPGIGYTNA